MEAELEPGDDAEVAATATDRPEQVRLRGRVGVDHLPVCGDHLCGEQRIDGQAVLADEETDSAAERDAADADAAGVAEADGKSVLPGRLGELARGRAGLGPRGAGRRVDVDPVHLPEVEDDTAVAAAVAGETVATAPHRQFDARLAGKADDAGDLSGVTRPDDGRRLLVEAAEVAGPRRVVAGVAGKDAGSRQTLGSARRQWNSSACRILP